MARVPAVQVLAGGNDITAGLGDVLISVTVDDAEGQKSDKMTIVIDNKDERILPPGRGEKLTVLMGYKNDLQDMGTFVVDKIKTSLWPRKYTITANSADFEKGNSKGMKPNKSWENQPLETIMNDVAGMMHVSLEMSPELGPLTVRYEAMTEESPAHFAQRLANQHRAVLKVNSGKMIFLTKKEASEQQPQKVIRLQDLTGVNADVSDRSGFGAVVASYISDENSQRIEVRVETGSDGPDLEIRHAAATEEEAKATATGKKDEQERQRGSLSIDMEGDPSIMAGVRLQLMGVQSDVDGAWVCKTAQHKYQRGPSYKTSATADKEPEESCRDF